MTEAEPTYAERDIVRGRFAEFLVDALKRIRIETNLPVFLGAVFVLFFGIYTALSEAGRYAEGPIGEETVVLVSALLSLAYVTWVGWSAHQEFSDLDRAHTIRKRPAIDVAGEAFGLLRSTDSEARRVASYAVVEIVSLGPEKIVDQLAVDVDELVEYLIPLLDDSTSDTRANVASAVQGFARDYPGALGPYQNEILDALCDEQRTTDERSSLAKSTGYLALSTGTDGNRIETIANKLLDDQDSDLRIGACYMLAGVSSTSAKQTLEEIASQDSDPEVREHAKVLL